MSVLKHFQEGSFSQEMLPLCLSPWQGPGAIPATSAAQSLILIGQNNWLLPQSLGRTEGTSAKLTQCAMGN